VVTGLNDAKTLIAAAYDRSADGFASFADRLMYRFLDQPLVDAAASVDGTILDVASGSGALGARLIDAIGLDISPGQLRHNPMRRKIVGDAEAIPFDDDAFAAAVSAFGVNHWPRPERGVAEMARVAPFVGMLTWSRPEVPFEPKAIVHRLVSDATGAGRTPLGELLDDLTNRTGSEDAIRRLLEGAGLNASVRTTTVQVPWPGSEAFVDYRMSFPTVNIRDEDREALRARAIDAINALDPHARRWRARLILGLGRRTRI